jgi:hypothetical protein
VPEGIVVDQTYFLGEKAEKEVKVIVACNISEDGKD